MNASKCVRQSDGVLQLGCLESDVTKFCLKKVLQDLQSRAYLSAMSTFQDEMITNVFLKNDG